MVIVNNVHNMKELKIMERLVDQILVEVIKHFKMMELVKSMIEELFKIKGQSKILMGPL